MQACGIDPSEVLVVRHTYNEDGLRRGETSYDDVVAYVRVQGLRFNAQQPRLWLNFLAERPSVSLLGRVRNPRRAASREDGYSPGFRPAPLRRDVSLAGRLVMEWSKNAINWAKKGRAAEAFPLLEISDPEEFTLRAMTTCSWTGWSFGRCSRTPGTPHGARPSARCRASISSATGAPASTTSARRRMRSASWVGGWRTPVTVTAGTVPCATSGRRRRSLATLPVEHPSGVRSVYTDGRGRLVRGHYKRALLTRQFGMNRN